MVLHEMGTLDHAAAVSSQIREAGWFVKHVVLGDEELPPWALGAFPSVDRLTDYAALEEIAGFAAAWLPEPYEQLRPTEWRNLWERVPVVYSGYTLPLSDWKRGLYELPFFDKCSLILASGPVDALEHRNAGGHLRRVITSGDPLMFEVAKLRETASSERRMGSVLWAPHWTLKWVDGARGFATWEWVVGELYRFFKSHREVRLVVRPHPHLRFSEGGAFARSVARKLFSLPNVERSRSSMLRDIEESNLLVSDGVAILAYFAATGKPVVVVESHKAPAPFGPLGREIVSQMARVGNRTELGDILVDFSSGRKVSFSSHHDLPALIRSHFIVEHLSPGQALIDHL